jgi:hypothetical protein
VSGAPRAVPLLSISKRVGALSSDGSEFVCEDAHVGLAILSRGVVLVVDDVGRGGAALDDRLRHAKELVYVFERCPCTSCLALQAY